MAKSNFYVVWHGVTPGIYNSWKECKAQVIGYEGAAYKGFPTREEAEKAYASSPYIYIARAKEKTDGQHPPTGNKLQTANPPANRTDTVLPLPLEVRAEALAVDAACSGNPGPMEYRGIYLRTGKVVFHFGPTYGTNNIGEFLAIVHALALLKQKGLDMPVYSDSRNAILWIKQKRCKTNLKRDTHTEELYRLIERAEKWLKENSYTTPILKWETARWGEVPADFGRK